MSILSDTVALLGAIGLTVTEQDALLAMLKASVEERILNFIHQTTVPEGLHYAEVEMVAGEYLSVKQACGALSIEGLDLSGVKALSEGDTSVTYADGGSAAEQFTALVSRYRNHEADLLRYRRLEW